MIFKIKYLNKYSLLLIIVGVMSCFMYSCEPIITYSEIPVLSFKKVEVKDTLDALGNKTNLIILTLSVIDGDSDIGLSQGDTIGPFHKDSAYYYNLFLDLASKEKGEYTNIEMELPNNYRTPYIEASTSNNKTLKADVVVEMSYPMKIVDYDTIKYTIHLFDRAFNKSNIIETPDIALKKNSD